MGWYYDKFEDLIDGLIEMKKGNPGIVDVFYACHREPIDKVKENFEWKEFENKGLEWGGYQQAFEHLDIKDNEIYFFMNDDLIIKDWDFVNACISMFNGGSKVIGNGLNYGFYLEQKIHTAVLWHKSSSLYKPNYYVDFLKESPWIHMPFEKYELKNIEDFKKQNE